MLLSAARMNVSDSAWSIGSRSGSLSSVAIGPASRNPSNCEQTPVTTAAQNAVSIWRRVTLLRWMSASPRP